MPYGLETVVLTKRLTKRLEVVEMRMLRRAKGVTSLDRVQNEEMRRDMKIEEIGCRLREGRPRWFVMKEKK